MALTLQTIVVAAVATGVSWFLTPPAARLGRSLGLVDAPSGRRTRRRPIPTIGGVVVFGSFAASLLAAFVWRGGAAPLSVRHLAALLLGGSAILALGMADDRRGVDARVRLLVQTGVAAAMLGAGIGIDHIRLPFGRMIELGWLGYPVTVLWFVGFMNALNMIDGLDGLASGIVAITSLALLAVGIEEGNPLLVLTCGALLGSTVGFLLHNFPKGDVYLGDAGSTVLGFFLAGASVLGAANDVASKSLVVAAACMAIPAFDVVTAVTRRLRGRRGIMTPDRSHVHHRLIRFGLSPRGVVLVLWGATVFFGGQALGLLTRFGAAFILGSYAAAAFVLNRIRMQRRKNLVTTNRELKDEVFYLLGATDSVERDEEEAEELRQIIVEQIRREMKYRRSVRSDTGPLEPGRAETAAPPEKAEDAPDRAWQESGRESVVAPDGSPGPKARRGGD